MNNFSLSRKPFLDNLAKTVSAAHIHEEGLENWHKGQLAKSECEYIEDGKVGVINTYGNGETYYYIVNLKDGDTQCVSEKEAQNDLIYQVLFVLNNMIDSHSFRFEYLKNLCKYGFF